MRLKQPIKRVCHLCGRQYESWEPREMYCLGCKETAKAEAQKRKNIARHCRAKIHRVETREQPTFTLSEYNRFQRERGLTYGGKPIINASPREPKFMKGHWPVKGDRA